MTEPMLAYFFYLLPILLILVFAGSLFVVHMRKSDGTEFYSPWIGASILVNIAVLMNFSKIPIGKNLFNIEHFNGMIFIGFILFFIGVLSWLFINKRDFGFREKHIWLYCFYIICVIIFTASFFKVLGSSNQAERAKSLQTISLTEEMIVNKHIEPNQFAVGIPLLISYFSKVFDISPLTISRILHALFTIFVIPLFSVLILKTIKPKGKNMLFILSLSLFLVMFILFPLKNISITGIFIIGVIALIANITFDYLKVLENTQDSFFYVEEIVLAQLFLFLAVLNGTAFKIGIALFLILIGFRLLTQKNQLSYGWLRPIFIMCLLNPLLIGLVLRF
jgi:hypothetical protein